MKKKFLALVLTLAMVLSLVPATALATEGTPDTASGGVVDGYYTNTGEWKSGELENAIPGSLKDTVTTVDKTAKKVDGQDNQYEVTLKVEMKQKKTDVPPGAAATVLVIDTSGSMNDCTKEEHQHTDACYQWAECTPQVNPNHYKDGKHKRNTKNPKCERKDDAYYYRESDSPICGKEGHEHNSDNCKAPYRIDATKEAAKNFLKSYRGGTVSNGNWVPSTTSLKRYVSIVSFNIGASKSDWVDVSTKKGYDKAIASINDLSANGGTNLDAGLRMADAQLGDSKVTSMPANVVVLTDGKPTFYLGDQEYIDGDYYYWPNIRWVTVGEITYRVHGKGSQCNDATYTTTVSTAKALKQAASVYTVCFGASNEKLEAKDKPTVSEFLKTKIATQQAEGKYAYDANNATELYKAFAAISSSVVSGLNTGKVTDALPNGVSCTDGTFNEKGELTWQLDPAQATKRGPDSNGFITYTYEKTYKVQIDPTAEDLNVAEGGYVPLNRPTKLTVQHNGSPVQIPFPIPAGKVTATITFKSETGGTIGDNKTEISGSYASGSDFPTIPATTANDGYTFDGWYDKDGKKVETFPATVTGSATYTAKWTKDTTPPKPDSTDVYVYFQTQNTNGQKVNISGIGEINYNGHDWATLGKISTTRTLTSGTQYTGTDSTLVAVGNDAKTKLTGNALWNGNASIAPTVLAHIQWTKLAQLDGADDYYVEAGTTCWHLDGQITGYKVTYATGAGNENVTGMPTSNETYYLSGSEYTVSNATPQRTGYTFDGWMYQNSDDITYQANAKFDMPNEDVTLTAQWTPNNGTKYKVEHYQQQLDGTTYELKETDTLSGNTGDSVTAQYKTTYTGFTYDETVTGTVKSGTIAADGSLVLKLYYTRNSYNVTYQYEGTAPDGAPDVNALSGTHKYGAEVTVDTKVSADAVAGYTFSGWSTDDVTVTDGKFTMPATNVTLKGKFEEKTNPLTYTINQHFMDGKGKERDDLRVNGEAQMKPKDTPLSDLIEGKTGPQSKENKNYVYVSSKTTYTVDQVTNPLNADSKLTKDTTIDLYYYLDNWKDGDSKTPTADDSATGGDGIPDCYQVLVNYKSGDTNRGSVGPRTMEVLTIKSNDVYASEGQVVASGSTANATGSRCYFSNWTNDDNQQIANSATLEARTIDAKGGDVYTFTANFGRSSGGSNRPKPPVVEIPDDVPTGLNGKDHYAYVVGYPDGMVYPQKNITRAEVATIFFRLLTDETREANMTKSNGYNDMKDGAWYTCAVSTLSKMGIIKGYEDGSFKPDASISRAEFAAIAARFDPDGDKTPATFSDVSSHWAKDEISIAANHGWIKGYEDGSFKPDQKITRAETMTLVNRVLNRLPETKDDLHKDMKTWVDNMDETAWYYLAVQEATNSHYFKNKTGTKFEQWTDLRDTRDWSELEK